MRHWCLKFFQPAFPEQYLQGTALRHDRASASLQAISRRNVEVVKASFLTVHDLKLDLLVRTAHRQGHVMELQAKELTLLEILLRSAALTVTRTMLLEQIWTFNFEPNTTVIETHVSRLRTKIDKPYVTPLIHTVRSIGYSKHEPR